MGVLGAPGAVCLGPPQAGLISNAQRPRQALSPRDPRHTSVAPSLFYNLSGAGAPPSGTPVAPRLSLAQLAKGAVRGQGSCVPVTPGDLGPQRLTGGWTISFL